MPEGVLYYEHKISVVGGGTVRNERKQIACVVGQDTEGLPGKQILLIDDSKP
jgi:hypothetical protein